MFIILKKRKEFLHLLLWAIILRLVLMPFFFHPDIKTYNYQVSHLKEGVIDVYQYISENKGKLSVRDDFTYYPLTYFFLGGYQILLSPLLGSNFTKWISDASIQSVEREGIFRYLFILKSLYLVLDISIAFLLLKFFDNPIQKKRIFKIWLFNPFSLIIIYIYSGIDIIPVFFTILSMLLLKSRKILFSSVMMGVAAAFKGYTLLFLPIFFLLQKKIQLRLITTIAFLTPFLLTILPFITSESFKEQALISGFTNRLVTSGFDIGFGESLMITVIALMIVFYYAYSHNKLFVNQRTNILIVMLSLFATIHYHLQWLLWILPFMVLLAVYYEKLTKLIFCWLTFAFVIPLLYDDRSMTISIFSPISLLYNSLPTPFLILQKVYNPYLTQSIIHSILFVLSLILIWNLIKLEKQ